MAVSNPLDHGREFYGCLRSGPEVELVVSED